MRICAKCKEHKPLDQFCTGSVSSALPYFYCRPCGLEFSKGHICAIRLKNLINQACREGRGSRHD